MTNYGRYSFAFLFRNETLEKKCRTRSSRQQEHDCQLLHKTKRLTALGSFLNIDIVRNQNMHIVE